MTDKNEYTLDQLDELELMNEENATIMHLVIAMDYVVQILKVANIPYAVMGGMSMIMRGLRGRTTTDVDIAVQSNARDTLQVVAADTRILRPRIQSVAGSGVARIYVATGPAFGDPVPPLAVEVDLILSGHRGAPNVLDQHTVAEIEWNGSGAPKLYSILKLKEMFRAKLSAFYQRESEKDYGDLRWMCERLTDRVRAVSDSLDVDQRAFFFDAIEQDTGLSGDAIDKISHTLRL